ncbi:hypothetical protein Ddye_011634 [Dipteronia dyeriana]|uniref:HMA domain-containing protein n=1 Tax=Dipteronia dyeriana TaxID=168575 RepID=A0AAE0CIE8_9ROSI|nr:hypothetical protein Ddye_011634 [Dipteronia dyeriana]
MKHKAVIIIPAHSEKCRSEAMEIAVGASGVESMTIKGVDKNQIEVTGKIDFPEITILLRKKIGYAFLESVNPVASTGEEGGGDKKKGNENEAKMQVVWPSYLAALPIYHDVHHVARDHSKYRCFIM